MALAPATRATFGSILDRKSSEVERPRPLPVGNYLCQVKGLPTYDKSTKKHTEYVEFSMVPIQALDDVDQEQLAEVGGLAGKTIDATFYLTEKSIWRLTEFLNDCGVEEDDLSIRQRVEQSPGCQVICTIIHEPSRDGKGVYANFGGSAPVDEVEAE